MDTYKTISGTCRLMRLREVLQPCGFSRATLYREIKLHTFPAPVKLSSRSVGWLQDDVMRWLDARVAQRGPAYQAHSQIRHQDAKRGAALKPGRRRARDEVE